MWKSSYASVAPRPYASTAPFDLVHALYPKPVHHHAYRIRSYCSPLTSYLSAITSKADHHSMCRTRGVCRSGVACCYHCTLRHKTSRVSDDPPYASIKVALAAGSYPVLPHPSPYYLTSNPVLRYPTPHSHILPRPTLESPAILLCPTSSYPL